MRRWCTITVLLFAACGTGRGEVPAVEEPVGAEAPSALAASLRALDEHCSGCHSGDPEIPDFTTGVLDPDLAGRAATMVASRRMPPAPDGLSHEELSDVLGALCAYLSPGAPETCLRAVGAPQPRGPMLPLPLVLDRARLRSPGTTPARRSELLMGQVLPPDIRLAPLDVTYLALVSAFSLDRCSTTSSATWGAAQERCLDDLLSFDELGTGDEP